MGALTSSRFSSANGERELLACAVFLAASLTDAIDGYLARRRAQVTTLGMLLDPVADKLLIAAAFVTLVQFNPHVVPAWMVVIIVGREFLVSGLRSIAASEGFTIQASDLGKLKMCVQIVCVLAAILDHHWAYVLGAAGVSDRRGLDLGDGRRCRCGLPSITLSPSGRRIDQASDRRRRKRSFVLSRRRKRNDVPAI